MAVPVLLAAALSVGVAPPAHALSCVSPAEAMRGAAHVFVGSVADVRGSKVLLDVDEVWRGSDLGTKAWVTLGLEMWSPWVDDGEPRDGGSSPERYVVATDAVFVTNPCRAWPLDEAEHLGLVRPYDARQPVTGGPGGDEPSTRPVPVQAAVGGGALLLGVATAGGALLRRRGRRPARFGRG